MSLDNKHTQTLQESIARQRGALKTLLSDILATAAQECSQVWGDRPGLNAVLSRTLEVLSSGKYLYALDTNAIQLSDTISREGPIETDFGRDRSSRPYMNERSPVPVFYCRRPISACVPNVPR